MARGHRKTHLDGTLHPDFQNVASLLEGVLERQVGGGALCIYHHGECVADLWGGDLDRAGTTPWRRDTMVPSFATTMGVTSTLVHIMADRGLIDYDAYVAEYWPEFAQQGKEEITVRQVLTHQAGLYHIRHMIDEASRMSDWGYMVDALERAEPIHVPGERTAYHGLTYGFMVGEILRRVTGKRVSALVQREIAQPLGLDGMFVGAPESELQRVARLIRSRPSQMLQGIPTATIPSWLAEVGETASSLFTHSLGMIGIDLDFASMVDAFVPHGLAELAFDSSATPPATNGLFTARSLARMYAALSQGGEIDGVRLLSRRALARGIEPQPEAEGRSVLPIDMRWRLGYHAIPTSRGIPEQAFGHFGFGGSGAWADPSRELSFALTVNCGAGAPLGDLRIVRLGGAALAAASRRDGELFPMAANRLGDSWSKARTWFRGTSSTGR